MATSTTGTRKETSYQFELSHSDVVSMMNDPNVLLQGGHVSATQVFNIVFKKGNGALVILKEMKPTDTLGFQFTVVENTEEDETFGGIDVQD